VAEGGPGKYPIGAGKERYLNRHIIEEHIGKTDEELATEFAKRGFNFYTGSAIGKRLGSFDSRESANDFIGQTLERNQSIVDQVSSGKKVEYFVAARFGYRTGREIYRPSPYSRPYMRNTYGVGVLIRHDPTTASGYRVITAYPRND